MSKANKFKMNVMLKARDVPIKFFLPPIPI